MNSYLVLKNHASVYIYNKTLSDTRSEGKKFVSYRIELNVAHHDAWLEHEWTDRSHNSVTWTGQRNATLTNVCWKIHILNV